MLCTHFSTVFLGISNSVQKLFNFNCFLPICAASYLNGYPKNSLFAIYPNLKTLIIFYRPWTSRHNISNAVIRTSQILPRIRTERFHSASIIILHMYHGIQISTSVFRTGIYRKRTVRRARIWIKCRR